jgi:hypothetical protein
VTRGSSRSRSRHTLAARFQAPHTCSLPGSRHPTDNLPLAPSPTRSAGGPVRRRPWRSRSRSVWSPTGEEDEEAAGPRPPHAQLGGGEPQHCLPQAAAPSSASPSPCPHRCSRRCGWACRGRLRRSVIIRLLIFFMELNCLYVNCNVLCIFWQIMNTYLLNLMHKIFKTCMFCVCTAFVLFFPSWLASLVELDRARGKLEPSPIFRLVCKTSQPEPSPFAAS